MGPCQNIKKFFLSLGMKQWATRLLLTMTALTKVDSDLTNEEILSILRANELTKLETGWLTILGIDSENKVLQAIGKIMIERQSVHRTLSVLI